MNNLSQVVEWRLQADEARQMASEFDSLSASQEADCLEQAIEKLMKETGITDAEVTQAFKTIMGDDIDDLPFVNYPITKRS